MQNALMQWLKQMKMLGFALSGHIYGDALVVCVKAQMGPAMDSAHSHLHSQEAYHGEAQDVMHARAHAPGSLGTR